MNKQLIAEFEAAGFTYEYPGFLSLEVNGCDFTVGECDNGLCVQVMTNDGDYVA